jgi:Zn-dependent protease
MAKERNSKSSIWVARVGGIDIRMHWSFLVLVILVVWVNISGGASTVGASLLWITAIFASVLVHEYAHCIVARRRGAIVQDILLLPVGGLSQLKEMPEGPADEFAIAIVGPLASFGVAALALAGGLAFGAHLWPPSLFAGSWFARLAWLNVLLGGFNLLPALPMDGGRVARALLERHHDRLTATRQAARIARILAVVMIMSGVLYDFWLVLIGLFVYLGASAEEQAVTRGRAGSMRAESAPLHAPTSVESKRGNGVRS